MIPGHFYFVKDEFYAGLPDCGLMTNKESGDRPCHYCFYAEGYFWMVPISSKVDKYRRIYQDKIARRGYCNSIVFGFVNGSERAFLLQNAFPISEQYVSHEYVIGSPCFPVTVSDATSSEINRLLRLIIRHFRQGRNDPLTNLSAIIAFLESN